MPLILGGSANCRIKKRNIISSGGLLIGGQSGVISPAWKYIGSGGLLISGGIYQVESASVVGSGGFGLGGEGLCRISKYICVPSGGFTLGGGAEYSKNYFSFSGSGGISFGGGAGIESTWKGDFISSWGGYAEATDPVPIFAVTPTDAYIPPNDTISNICDCTGMPLTLKLVHDLGRGAVIKEFIKRNGFVLPKSLNLIYNRINSSWQGNLYFRGFSPDSDTKERWNFTFEWQCTNSLTGSEDGMPVWRFSLAIIRRNEITQEYFDTKLFLAFPVKIICDDANVEGFDFGFSYNVFTGDVKTDHSLYALTSVFKDNIGLFKAKDFLKSPELNIDISFAGTTTDELRQDIKPAFPLYRGKNE